MRKLAVRAILVWTLMAAIAFPAAAGGRATRTRPGSGGAGGGQVSGRATQRDASPTRAAGHATYGYYHRHHRYPYHYSHYPYYYFYPYYFPYPWVSFAYHGWWYYDPVPYGHYGVREYQRVGPAAIETDVRPKKATVLVDGEDVGRAKNYNGTWDLLWLEPGEHVLEFDAPGHQRLRVTVHARPGDYYRIARELPRGEGKDPQSMILGEPRREPARIARRPRPPAVANNERRGLSRGFLKLRVRPDDAAIYLDGEFLAHAAELARLHGAIPVASGEHTVEVVRPGFEAETVQVVVEAGQAASLVVDLERRSERVETP